MKDKIASEANRTPTSVSNGPDITPEPARAVDNPLSDREMDVARLLATGASNNEIAEQLVISPHTVKVHLRNIYEKLGVSSRTEASLLLLQQGWMVLPGVEAPEATPVSDKVYPEPEPLLDGGARLFSWQPAYLVAVIALVALLLTMPSWLRSSGAATTDLLSDASSTTMGQPVVDIMPRWTSQAPLPAARSRLALALVTGKAIYAIGGEDSTGAAVAQVDVYDLARNEWQDGPALPFPLANLAATVLGEEIYVAGGTTTQPAEDGSSVGLTISSSLLHFNVADAEWTDAGELPVALAGASLVATSDALYLLGGWDGEAMHAEVWQLDLPITGRVAAADWRVITQMGSAHAFGGAVIRGDEIYVAGGYDGRQELDTAQRYQISTDRWEVLPPMATPRGGIQLLDDGLAIFAVGGGWDDAVSTLERFDPFTGLWSHFPAPIAGEWRNLGAAASATGYLYFTGGWSDSYLNVHLHYQSSFRSFLPATQSDDGGSR